MANRALMRAIRRKSNVWSVCAALVGSALLVGGCGGPDGGNDFDVALPQQIVRAVSEDGPNPASTVIGVSNRGNCALALVASAVTTDGAAWLSVTPTVATVDPRANVAVTLAFEVVETGLLPGNYVGSATFSGTCVSTGQLARGSPRTVAVNLRVTPIGASIVVDRTTIGVDVVPVADAWEAIADNTLHPGRSSHTAIWTGREMWVFGGLDAASSTVGVGGRYDPLVDDWNSLPTGGPGARFLHTAVWTGNEMIVWGGQTTLSASSVVDTGARLNGDLNWTALSTTDAPAARAYHTAVWTGTEMIVFGGFDGTGTALATGARYRPADDTWVTLPSLNAPSARGKHAAVWTGTEMLVWGGEDTAGNDRSTGGRYDPVANRWTDITAGGPARTFLVSTWTGSRWILYGGESAGVTYADGQMYSPGDDAWEAIAADTQRRADLTSSVWTGSELIVWGGTSGRRFNPANGMWSPVTGVGQPSTRQSQSAVWTGISMIVYGGTVGLADGAIYR